MSWLTDKFQRLLTRLGAHCSSRTIFWLDDAINYLEVGRWFTANGIAVPPRVRDREAVFDAMAQLVRDRKVLYLEFGVWEGKATRYWSAALRHHEAMLHGFDSFEGLPEAWNTFVGKGAYSAEGRLPNIVDTRVTFHKGLFSDTLPKYILPPHDVLLVNIDCDIYSSTAEVLEALKPFLAVGTILYFDEFWDRHHELKAFDEFVRATEFRFRVICVTRALRHVAFQRIA